MYTLTRFSVMDSTNEYLMQLAKSGERGKIAVIADAQTKGRGRRGNKFFSQGEGLYMSLIVSDIDYDKAMLLTPMTACAVCGAVEELFGITLGVKWVNDLFLDGKKVCGILCESKFDFDRKVLDYAVVGIGINLVTPVGGFPEELATIAGALLDKCTSYKRLKLAEKILEKIEEYLPKLGEPELIEEYKARSVILGREIWVHAPQGAYKALAVDIDLSGNLIVEQDGTRQTLSSGEISVRF